MICTDCAEAADAQPVTWAAAITALRDTARYRQWHAEQLATTGVDHHRWWEVARRILADYLEAVGPGQGQEDQKLIEEEERRG